MRQVDFQTSGVAEPLDSNSDEVSGVGEPRRPVTSSFAPVVVFHVESSGTAGQICPCHQTSRISAEQISVDESRSEFT